MRACKRCGQPVEARFDSLICRRCDREARRIWYAIRKATSVDFVTSTGRVTMCHKHALDHILSDKGATPASFNAFDGCDICTRDQSKNEEA